MSATKAHDGLRHAKAWVFLIAAVVKLMGGKFQALAC